MLFEAVRAHELFACVVVVDVLGAEHAKVLPVANVTAETAGLYAVWKADHLTPKARVRPGRVQPHYARSTHPCKPSATGSGPAEWGPNAKLGPAGIASARHPWRHEGRLRGPPTLATLTF